MFNTTNAPSRHGFALAAGEGETYWWASHLFTTKCSQAGLGFVEGTLEAGSEPPMHIHTREDEFMYVIEGELTIYSGDDRFSVSDGGFVYMPRNVSHTFAVEGDGSARVFVMFTPNGFERVFSENRMADYVPGAPGPSAERHDLSKLGKAFEDAGVIVTGPHPRDAVA